MFSIVLFSQLFLSILAYPLPQPIPKNRLSTAPVNWADYQYRDYTDLGTYSFGYDIEDPATDNMQYRNEERHANGTISGSYGYLQPDGNVHVVEYVADQHGYRATVRISSRGQLKPVPVSDATVHYDIYSDLEAANAYNNNPWRRSPGFYPHRQQQYNPPHHPSAPQRPIATITSHSAIPTIAYVQPPPTAASFLFVINDKHEHIAFDDDNVSDPQGPITPFEILPGFLTINQRTHQPPAVVYLKKMS